MGDIGIAVGQAALGEAEGFLRELDEAGAGAEQADVMGELAARQIIEPALGIAPYIRQILPFVPEPRDP